jgi:SAM-dependent methyltransferase
MIMNYKEKYKKVWQHPAYRYFSPGTIKLPTAIKEIPMNNNMSVIDLGCGTGRVLYELEMDGYKDLVGVEVAGNALEYDLPKLVLAEVHNVKFDLKRFDVAFSCNTFEHMTKKDIDAALEVVKHIAKIFFISVSFYPDEFGPENIGEPLHLTVEPPEWWEEKLKSYFDNVKKVDTNSWACK